MSSCLAHHCCRPECSHFNAKLYLACLKMLHHHMHVMIMHRPLKTRSLLRMATQLFTALKGLLRDISFLTVATADLDSCTLFQEQ